MRCIKTDLILKYMDKAATEKEAASVEKHLAVCRECTSRLTEMQQRGEAVREALNLLVGEDVAVPAFFAPAGIPESMAAKRRKIYVLGFVATSVLICLVITVMFTLKTPSQRQIIVVQTVDREINANQTVTKQQMVINIIDDDRKVTSSPLK